MEILSLFPEAEDLLFYCTAGGSMDLNTMFLCPQKSRTFSLATRLTSQDWQKTKWQSYYKTGPFSVSDPEGYLDVTFYSMKQ